jgi:GTPase SAR1 family protein
LGCYDIFDKSYLILPYFTHIAVKSEQKDPSFQTSNPFRKAPSKVESMGSTMGSTSQDASYIKSDDLSDTNTAPSDTQGQPVQQGESVVIKSELDITSSLEHLQTDEQRRVLDTVANVRKCGLESILSLPQLVVCGDQSAGKSSVLEALTEIPFPRNDNLCTRFATEIILRRATANSLKIKIIPDTNRTTAEQATLQAFEESITNFDELPRIMNSAMAAMDVNSTSTVGSKPKAFARDVLSIEIEGPLRPQLTLVDIPGLIQTDTKGVTKADVELVTEITDQYITRSRTICLAVVSAANDYANQKILTKVRAVDPEGHRTLGIITKPDRLDAGSGLESSFLDLARNEDIRFSLGWHVLKNRKYEEREFSLEERKYAEDAFFCTSNFKSLPKDHLGIDSLRSRLSQLLFEHVKEELPKLRNDLEEALLATKQQLQIMGSSRADSSECKDYLTNLSLDYFQVCKAAVDGHYEGEYFKSNLDSQFDLKSPATIRRLRAVIQYMNTAFAENMRINGHTYQVDWSDDPKPANPGLKLWNGLNNGKSQSSHHHPEKIDKNGALEWVRYALNHTRGRELVGNFNPLLVGQLFWDQCRYWEDLAKHHLANVMKVCGKFLNILLEDKCPKDVVSRLRSSLIEPALDSRKELALRELEEIVKDVRSYPINYNHYYTQTINERRQERQKASLAKCIEDATNHEKLSGCQSYHTSASVDIDRAIEVYSKDIDPNMDNVSCEEALDCVFAIYEVGPPATSHCERN